MKVNLQCLALYIFRNCVSENCGGNDNVSECDDKTGKERGQRICKDCAKYVFSMLRMFIYMTQCQKLRKNKLYF